MVRPVGDSILESTKVQVDVDIESRPREWKPIACRKVALKRWIKLIFVDGVRRMEGIVWISEPGKSDQQGICASYAAGAVEVGREADCFKQKCGEGCFRRIRTNLHWVQEPLCFDPIPPTGKGMAQLAGCSRADNE